MKCFLLAFSLSIFAVVLAASERISSKAEVFDPSMQQSYELRNYAGRTE